MFYVYAWYIEETEEIIYIGKGTKNRYKCQKRNKVFNEMIKRFKCEPKIIKFFDSEEEALLYEHKLICEYKEKGQCCCNLDNGGKGGVNFVWTPEMREYYSKYNIMKSKKQRERMSKYNPMKNKDVSSKVGLKHRKPFYIGDTLYSTLLEASEKYGVTIHAIRYWLKVGYNKNKELVYYKGAEKPNIDLSINKHISNNQKVLYDNIEYNSIKELARTLKVNYTTIFNYYQKHKAYNNKYIEKI